MVDEDKRLKAAILRQSLREIDARVAAIRADQRLFRRFNFGSDVQDIELSGLRVERADVVGQLEVLGSVGRLDHSKLPGMSSWFLLPIALGAQALRAILGSGQKSRPRQAVPARSNLDQTPHPKRSGH